MSDSGKEEEERERRKGEKEVIEVETVDRYVIKGVGTKKRKK